MNKKMHDLAFFRIDFVSAGVAAYAACRPRKPSPESKSASANAGKPAPICQRSSRRVVPAQPCLVHINHLVQVENDTGAANKVLDTS